LGANIPWNLISFCLGLGIEAARRHTRNELFEPSSGSSFRPGNPGFQNS